MDLQITFICLYSCVGNYWDVSMLYSQSQEGHFINQTVSSQQLSGKLHDFHLQNVRKWVVEG